MKQEVAVVSPLMLMDSKEKERAKEPPGNTSNSLPLLLPLFFNAIGETIRRYTSRTMDMFDWGDERSRPEASLNSPWSLAGQRN
uniref:Uncharacterized protein n=1 Tax=Pristionchus pacificus TaxID=54126 RepID=A0A2A6C9I4_PRIPA|eukprot:PDM74681.1 hypothetical protein PRIPAC_42037 [Pristionchus pacificus]